MILTFLWLLNSYPARLENGRRLPSARLVGLQRLGLSRDVLFLITFERRKYCAGNKRIVPAALWTDRRQTVSDVVAEGYFRESNADLSLWRPASGEK
jgi:hypothetical protein